MPLPDNIMPLPDNTVSGSKDILVKDQSKIASKTNGSLSGHGVQLGKKNDLVNVKVPDSPTLEQGVTPSNHHILPQDPHPQILEKLENEFKTLNEKLEQLQDNRSLIIGLDYTRSQYGDIAMIGAEGPEFAVETLEFMEGILPHQVLEEFKIFEHMEELSRIASLSNTLLVALNTGLTGVALIYKTSLMEESEKLLALTKDELNVKLNNKEITQAEFENLSKKLSNWEIKLELQRSALNAERTVVGISLVSTVTKIVSEPIKYIPHEVALAGAFLTSTSILLKGFEVIITGIEYSHARHGKELAREWMGDHKDWVRDHQYRFDRIAVDRNLNLDRIIEKLSFNELKTIFLKADKKFIETLNLYNIENKDDLIKFFNSHLKIKGEIARIFPAYEVKEADPREIGVKYIVNQSEDLLSRRKAVNINKIKILKNQFSSKEAEIREMMYASFKNSIRQFVRYNEKNEIVKNLDALNQWVASGSENPIAVELILRTKEMKELGKDLSDEDVNRLKMLIGVNGEELFNEWFKTQPIEKKLEFYVDHKETYEKTAMNALNELIIHKHDLEKKFVDFKYSSSKLRFFVTAGLFAGSTILTVMGLLTLPVPGVGFIFLAISGISFGLSGAILADSLRRSFILKPASTKAMFKGLYFKMAYANLNKAVLSYKKEIRHQKLEDIEKLIESIKNNKVLTTELRDAAIKEHEKMKLKLQAKEKQLEDFNKRLVELKQIAVEKGWEDFSRQASLKSNYQKYEGALLAFNEAIKECDLSLLSKKHRQLLENFLGIMVDELQAHLEKDPMAFKKEMLNFFGGSDVELITFIRRQNKMEELVKP